LDATTPRLVALFLASAPGGIACSRASTSRAAPAEAEAGVAIRPPVSLGVACGALDCLQLDSPADALRVVLASAPRVLAVGEAHAPLGATVPSAARQFTSDLLPALRGRASDLLVELMKPPEGCADATAAARAKQAPATSQQAPSNQSDYLAMGERARELGIVPDMLRPSCADMDAVRGAGESAIEASLMMIARLSAAQAGKLLDRDLHSETDGDKMVVVYGGMIHNDLDPSPERRAWSYAPALDARAGGRIVTLDLVVPEFIGQDETWRALPWFAAYDDAKLGAKATLFRLTERSFVLVFPRTSRP
jgi:hypothetical protein